MPPKLKEIDHGWKRIQREFLKSKPTMVKVGVQGPGADEAHGKGTTNIMLASVHEFGSPSRSIPERSFFRSTFDKNVKRYRATLKKLGSDLINKKSTRAAGLAMLGEDYRADIIDRVRQGKIKQDLSAETQRRRGESGPALYDTGQMIGAISAVVVK